MTQAPIVVFGGTGFLGTRIVARLVASGATVRVAVRHPERVRLPADGTGGDRIVPMRADIRDAASVATAMTGCTAAVNAVSLYVESRGATFEDVHVHGAHTVALQARDKGASRLVLVSGLGADPQSPSAYIRARARGEAALREVFPGAVVLRPSVMFGTGDDLISTLDSLTRYLPVLPLFGHGTTRLQPVHAGDVAEAAVRAVRGQDRQGVFELGGPQVYTYRELIALVLQRAKRRRLLLPVPFALWAIGARAVAVLPRPPVTPAQVALMRRDNVVAPGAATFADLGIAPVSLTDSLRAAMR